jgi:hypothetical protein
MDLRTAGVYLASMKDVVLSSRSRGERVQKMLMIWGAVILFALGFLLLLAPRRVDGASSCATSDNEMRRIGTKTCYGCAGLSF